jgi:hypothetical protein
MVSFLDYCSLSRAGDTVNLVYMLSLLYWAFTNQPSSAKYGTGHLSMIHSINAACQMGVCRVFCCKTVAILCPSRPCPPRKRWDRALARLGFLLAWMATEWLLGGGKSCTVYLHQNGCPDQRDGKGGRDWDLAFILSYLFRVESSVWWWTLSVRIGGKGGLKLLV